MKMNVGMAEMLYSWAASSFSSTSTFKNTTSAISLDIASICGAITLHGPHLTLKKLNNDNDTFSKNFSIYEIYNKTFYMINIFKYLPGCIEIDNNQFFSSFCKLCLQVCQSCTLLNHFDKLITDSNFA